MGDSGDSGDRGDSGDSGQTPYISLYAYHNSPLECGFTPVQLLMNRRTKSIIPISNKLLKPQTINNTTIQIWEIQNESDRKAQVNIIYSYNTTARFAEETIKHYKNQQQINHR